MSTTVLFLPGDCIGPEVAAEAAKALTAASDRFNLGVSLEFDHVGGAAFDAYGTPLADSTLEKCKSSAAVFLGAVGGPQYDTVPRDKRPEQGLLTLRKSLEVFANLRPATVFPELACFSRLRADIIERGVDLLTVRELTGDIYFGEPRGEGMRDGLRYAYDTMVYDENEIARIAHVAFKAARGRRSKVCSVDKANVLAVSRLWRAVVEEVHKEYPDVALEHMYVDNAAMQLVSRPDDFDVILTGNLFGDILSDQSAAIIGSLGMLPSASLGSGSLGLYEPSHGSAPDIAGQNKANPLASILSVAMMLRLSLQAPQAADVVEEAVRTVIREGYRTVDLIAPGQDGTPVSCSAMGDLVAQRIKG